MVNNARDYNKYVSKPSFVSQKIFSENFVVIHEIKPVLTLDKPIYVGFSILNLSKLLMYEFHDKYIKNIMPSCCVQTLTLQLMKLKQMMFMKIFMKINICLILVIIHEIQSFLILLIKK